MELLGDRLEVCVSVYVLQYQLLEKIGFCLKRKYNLYRNLLSNKLSPKLEAESSFIREKKNKNLISY